MRRALTSLAGLLLLGGHAIAALDPPQPVAPTAEARTSPTPTFHWAASPGATMYRLWIQNVTDGTATLSNWIKATTSYTLPEENALVVGKSYRWAIKAWSQPTGTSVWSAAHDFRVGRLRRYSLSPADLTRSWGINNAVCASFAVSSGNVLMGGVHLPDGAVIVGFSSYWKDTSDTADIEVILARGSVTSYADLAMATANSVGNQNVPSSTTAPLIKEPRVENLKYSYCIWVGFGNYGDGKVGRFLGAEIEYLE